MADRGCNRAETWREEKMVRGREAQRELKREREREMQRLSRGSEEN